MQIQVTRWGDSLGLRIPKALADQIGIAQGSRVEVEMDDDRIVISSARPRHTLAELLADMTPGALNQPFPWGADLGREAIDE